MEHDLLPKFSTHKIPSMQAVILPKVAQKSDEEKEGFWCCAKRCVTIQGWDNRSNLHDDVTPLSQQDCGEVIEILF